MPQDNPSAMQFRRPFQIAQGEGEGAPVNGAHVSTPATHELEHKAGEIPKATMLFGYSLMVAVGMVIFGVLALRKLESVPRGFQNFAEWVAESMNNFTISIIGPEGRQYTWLSGTIFIYILFSNLIGLIPGFHSPTSNLTLNLAIGVIVFVYVQYQGIKNNGPVNYIKHFAGPIWWLSWLMLPIELISEIIKPFTLAVRLFGNIFGEDQIIMVLAGLLTAMGASKLGWLPVHFPVLLLSVLTDIVQALVFAILTCIYISLMLPHGHEEDRHDEGALDAPHAHAAGH